MVRDYVNEEPEGGLEGFLERVALVADADQIPEAPSDAEGAAMAAQEGMVTLMTLHTAKGWSSRSCSSPAWNTAYSRTSAQ